ncbi:hypothetical protein A2454_03850 [Candidatus Peribacteria bacterium RIFOXYC2_FULL_55_14]|nr:MAG: hypothetical protein UY85_C0018G0020 [Candidatus Peribacteria bacterium GW2011_GWB1_54_5]OGJ71553.1 MAG: hypothetical protein A2198_05105 [Candidatus Peribacteria bacterium RIFOXYA1_FULL_56_14]OGJ72946.1 MAG: hypothetical protein A2217_06615 [Candidatus Peribacteria bacterium RIFOXYA2_FULL_55_28]OGJ73935.1 MAG: hypothetical protein A2384_04885 [Candidatus Peribacteria bacterium RIFOXYB1_FULL_54_35]OGJ76112.1 MAG: hypothetical protein A2327_04355 [Candidatus Peribacteria bacterium RIFOXY
MSLSTLHAAARTETGDGTPGASQGGDHPATDGPALDDLGTYIVERTRRDPDFLRRVPAHLRLYGDWYRAVVAQVQQANPQATIPESGNEAIPKNGSPLEHSTVFVFEYLLCQGGVALCDQCGKRNSIRGTVDLKVDDILTIRARVCEDIQCAGGKVFEELDPEAQHRALYNGTLA